MKSKMQLIVAGALVCASGCNTSVTEATKPVTPAGTSVKQNSQQQPNAKPAAPGSSSAPTTPPSSPAAPAATATVLEGTWSTGCASVGTTPMGPAYSEQTLTFVGNQGYGKGGIYTDADCTKAMPGVSESPKWLTITIGETDAKTGLTEVSDVSVDTTGTKTQEYNVFKIDGDTLTLGDASTVAGDYPTDLDTKFVFKKQAKADAIPPQP